MSSTILHGFIERSVSSSILDGDHRVAEEIIDFFITADGYTEGADFYQMIMIPGGLQMIAPKSSLKGRLRRAEIDFDFEASGYKPHTGGAFRLDSFKHRILWAEEPRTLPTKSHIEIVFDGDADAALRVIGDEIMLLTHPIYPSTAGGASFKLRSQPSNIEVFFDNVGEQKVVVHSPEYSLGAKSEAFLNLIGPILRKVNQERGIGFKGTFVKFN